MRASRSISGLLLPLVFLGFVGCDETEEAGAEPSEATEQAAAEADPAAAAEQGAQADAAADEEKAAAEKAAAEKRGVIEEQFNTLKKAFEENDYATVWGYMPTDTQEQVMKSVPDVKKALKKIKKKKDKKDLLQVLGIKNPKQVKSLTGPKLLAFQAWSRKQKGDASLGESFVGHAISDVSMEGEEAATVKTDKGSTVHFMMQDGKWKQKPEAKE